jgi:putative transposase
VDELSAIPQPSLDIALQRFEMLRPHLEGLRSLRAIASEALIPYRTAVRWASGYRKSGLAALARKGRTDQGDRRLASTQLIQAIEGLALERPPLPISFVGDPADLPVGITSQRATNEQPCWKKTMFQNKVSSTDAFPSRRA